MKIGEYRGKSAEEIERQLARDLALSEISHALYLGREVARKEFEMKAARAKEKSE
jgi:thymidylate synthase